MRFFFLILFLLTSCSTSHNIKSRNIVKFDFDKMYDFSKYQDLLIKYNRQNDYPDIDLIPK